MTRDRLWLALAILLPALAATIAPMSTVDLAYQVRAGELMLGSLAVLRADPFTFTALGDPWLNQQWGAGVLFALVHGLGGWGGLALLRALLVAAAVGLVAARLPPLAAGAPGGAARAGRVRRRDRRARPAGPALRDRALRRRPGDPRLAGRASAPGLGDPAPRPRLGEPARELLPGPGRRRWSRSLEDLVARRPGRRRLLVVLVAVARRHLRHPVRPGGLGVRGSGSRRTPRSPASSPSGSARRRFTVTGALFYASVVGAGCGRGPRDAPARRAGAGPHARLAGRAGVPRRLRRARRRLVGVRGARRAGADGGRSPGGRPRRPATTRAPSASSTPRSSPCSRSRWSRSSRRSGAGRSAHRPAGPPPRRAGRPRAVARRPRRPVGPRRGAPAVGLVVRLGGARHPGDGGLARRGRARPRPGSTTPTIVGGGPAALGTLRGVGASVVVVDSGDAVGPRARPADARLGLAPGVRGRRRRRVHAPAVADVDVRGMWGSPLGWYARRP